MARFHDWSLRNTAQILKKSSSLSEEDVWSFSSLLINLPVDIGVFTSLLWKDRSFTKPSDNKDEIGVNWIKQWPGASSEDDEMEPDDELEPNCQ